VLTVPYFFPLKRSVRASFIGQFGWGMNLIWPMISSIYKNAGVGGQRKLLFRESKVVYGPGVR